jgi:hypothetical protein
MSRCQSCKFYVPPKEADEQGECVLATPPVPVAPTDACGAHEPQKGHS